MSRAAGGRPGPLTTESIGSDPIRASRRWLEEAYAHSVISLPNAACLSTVGEGGGPEGRIVLVKAIGERGLDFFTNYESAKGRALDAWPVAALNFHWHDLERQLRVRGEVERISPGESDEYFRTRSRGSQIGAWASRQSAGLESRAALEVRFREIEARFRGAEVPRPSHWGGYRVIPRAVEFWQGRPDRLHDRFLCLRGDPEDGAWSVRRLNP